MIEKLTNSPMEYPWGSTHLIPDLMGFADTGTPVAEVWFGTHPASTARMANGSSLGEKTKLDFMLKFLAAANPLSIQSHPTKEQAKRGFESENSQGMALDDSSRIFKDDNHKPEILIAISPFRVLSGFRPEDEINGELAELAAVDSRFQSWAEGQKTLEQHFDFVFSEMTEQTLAGLNEHSELVSEIAKHHPNDRGLAIAFLLNEIYLASGEAVFLPAGNLHAYLQGLGVEVMASSDNVVRGGLTGKHVDVQKLKEITVFESLNPKLGPTFLQQGLDEYQTGVDDFRVYRVEPSSKQLLADIELPAEGILACVSGEVAVSNSLGERVILSQGEVCYISNEARLVSFAGSGTAYLATGN